MATTRFPSLQQISLGYNLSTYPTSFLGTPTIQRPTRPPFQVSRKFSICHFPPSLSTLDTMSSDPYFPSIFSTLDTMPSDLTFPQSSLPSRSSASPSHLLSDMPIVTFLFPEPQLFSMKDAPLALLDGNWILSYAGSLPRDCFLTRIPRFRLGIFFRLYNRASRIS